MRVYRQEHVNPAHGVSPIDFTGIPAGGVRIDEGFTTFLLDKLASLDMDGATRTKLLQQGLRDFQKTGKREFGSGNSLRVDFGHGDIDFPAIGISRGLMRVNSYVFSLPTD